MIKKKGAIIKLSRQKPERAFSFILVCVLSCLVNVNVFAQREERLPLVIEPGKGFMQIEIGDYKNELLKLLGKPSEDDGKYITYGRKGVQCLLEDNRVKTIFLFFRSRNYFTFDGITDKGIGFSSSIPDVIRKYGEPDRIGESTISEYGSNPGVREISLNYHKLGITFTFWDSELADIRLYSHK